MKTTVPKAGERFILNVNGIDYPFRWCPAGTFTMGSPASEADRGDDETQHQVTLSRGFWLLETQVTRGMWESVMGNNPSHFKGSKKLPVEQVSWRDCQGFIQKLNGLNIAPSGFRFSLPTESQWEYACRAGTTTPFHFGSVLNGDKANCDGNNPYGTSTKGKYLEKTSKVGSYDKINWEPEPPNIETFKFIIKRNGTSQIAFHANELKLGNYPYDPNAMTNLLDYTEKLDQAHPACRGAKNIFLEYSSKIKRTLIRLGMWYIPENVQKAIYRMKYAKAAVSKNEECSMTQEDVAKN